MTRVAEHRDQHIPHPPPRIEYGAGSDLPLAPGAKRLRSAKGEESREARDDFPPLQGEGRGGGGDIESKYKICATLKSLFSRE